MESTYIKNKLGIYVYPENISVINNIQFYVNSIAYTYYWKSRIINNRSFGILLYYKHNVYKK